MIKKKTIKIVTMPNSSHRQMQNLKKTNKKKLYFFVFYFLIYTFLKIQGHQGIRGAFYIVNYRSTEDLIFHRE